MSSTAASSTTRQVRVCIMGPTGDRVLTTVAGTDDAAAEVLDLAAIEEEFARLIGSGYAAFVTRVEGGTSEPTKSLVPDCVEHLLFRQGYGG